MNLYPYGASYVTTTCNGLDYGAAAPVAAGSLAGCVSSGVFDLSGNVAEWEDSCSGASGQTDPCRLRGGRFNSNSFSLRCNAADNSTRNVVDPAIGFRCCGG